LGSWPSDQGSLVEIVLIYKTVCLIRTVRFELEDRDLILRGIPTAGNSDPYIVYAKSQWTIVILTYPRQSNSKHTHNWRIKWVLKKFVQYLFANIISGNKCAFGGLICLSCLIRWRTNPNKKKTYMVSNWPFGGEPK
jgi:hypothetical protein